MGLSIKTKSPILYTNDCGETYLNADGSPYDVELPPGVGSGVLLPGQSPQQPKAASSVKKVKGAKVKGAFNKAKSLVGSGKVQNALNSASSIADSLKGIANGNGTAAEQAIQIPVDQGIGIINKDSPENARNKTRKRILIGVGAAVVLTIIILVIRNHKKGK